MSWPIIVAMLALMTISVLAVSAAERADPGNPLLRGSAVRQTVYIVVGIAGFLVATAIPYQRIGRGAYVLFGATLLMLAVLAGASVLKRSSFLIPAIRGSYRWINLGPAMIQPSEIIKVTYVLALAWYLRYRENYRRIMGLVPPFVLTIVPAVMILMEPDLGTTLLLFPTLFFMLFMAGAKLRHLLGVVALAAIIMFLPIPRKTAGKDPTTIASWKRLAYWQGKIGRTEYVIAAAPLLFMKRHQLSRIDGWLRQVDPLVAINRNRGFQLQESMIILGSGGLSGHDVLEQKNIYFRMLPDDQTDFIYAVIGGQWGFVGCAGLLVIYMGIFLCGVEIAGSTDDPFGRLLVVGVLGLMLAQLLINVGMTMGLAPITGMTLPMVSYGGSSMLVNCVAMGLLINVAQRRPIILGRKPFEYDRKQDQAGASEPLFEWAANQRKE